MKTLEDKAKYICMYDVLPQYDPDIKFTLRDKYNYYSTVYKNTLGFTIGGSYHGDRLSGLLAAQQLVKDITSTEELGLLLAICPSQAKDIMFAAWCSGYIGAKYFNHGKVFTALHSFCIQDLAAAVEVSQDPDFPDIVRLAVQEHYFDQYLGLF